MTPTRRDWIFLWLLVLCGGSSFGAIRVAVETAPPVVVAAGRLWIAAGLLFIYMWSTGRRMPPLVNGRVLSVPWRYALGIGFTGYALPMFLFPWAQQTVSSLLAGIYMAFMPVVTVALAATFADEPLTRRKLVGTLIGLGGVICLIGPGVLASIFSADVRAQTGLLLATTCYAVASVVMRNAPDVPARSFAAMFMLCGALMSTPLALAALMEGGSAVSGSSAAAIAYLGIVPTGITAIFIIEMIRSAGASFLGLANYVTPAVAILFGVLLFGEVLEWRYVLGLTTILVGVFTAQPGPIVTLWRRLRQAA